MDDKGIYYFHQGTNYESYNLLGAHYYGDYTIFRVWAPNAKRVSVVGDFNQWYVDQNPMVRINNEGLWEAKIEGVNEFDCYQYAITTHTYKVIHKSDPYGFHSELRPAKASKVYNINKYQFSDDVWMKNRSVTQAVDQPLNIYEVHLGSWRRYIDNEFFNYRKLGHELSEYAQMMGYTHIEIMPVSEYPYDPSWGYQVTNYYAITSRYGTPDDFMDFVNTCHLKGIGVIIDWVPGHFVKDSNGLIEFDGKDLYEHPDSTRKEHKGWGTRCFDYGRCEIQSFLVSNAMFLCDKFHVDGIRVDAVASMLYLDYGRNKGEWVPNTYGGNINLDAVAFLEKCNKAISERFPDVILIAEESTAYPKVTTPVDQGGLGFTYKWNMGWMNDTIDYIKTDPLFRQYNHHQITFQMTYIYSEKYILAISHDEVVHMKGSMINKMPGEYDQKFASLRSYMTYMITHPGKKLIFMGAEIGQFREWSEERELDWSVLSYDKHQQLQAFNRDLNHIYKRYPSLYQNDSNWDGFEWLIVNDNTHNVFGYQRKGSSEILVCILNFAYANWDKYAIAIENGQYDLIINSDASCYGGTNQPIEQFYQVNDGKLVIDLPSSTGIILRKVK